MERRRPGLRRALLLVPLAFLSSTFIAPVPPPPLGGPALAALHVAPVPLYDVDPSRRRVGRLTFLAGWQLSSSDRRFGGLSAMQIVGGQAMALSDTGVIFRFALPRRAGTTHLLIHPLPRSGSGGKAGHDSEALLLDEDSAWIAFERSNRIARFELPRWREVQTASPAPMRRWSGNRGGEALVRLPDGRFLVFSEGAGSSELADAVLFAGDPANPATPSRRMRYRREPGFRVTDAALLADGRLMLLHRRFTLFGGSAKLTVIALEDLRRGRRGAVIADLRSPATVDNFEALSVTEEGGETIVRLASDNNFMAMQRSLLLEFRLEDLPPA